MLSSYLENKSPEVKTMITMQCFHQKKTAWTTAEKQLALSLFYKSPSNYKFLMKKLGFSLPSLSTIQSWLKVNNMRTGVENVLINKLKLKVESMTIDEKQCVLMFDEISLKKNLKYNHFYDVIEGYEDFGSFGRNPLIANQGLLFYLRGLLYNWKLPFCYYISSGPTKGDMLAKIIKQVVTKLHSIGLQPRILVCDQGANNRNAFSILGSNKVNHQIKINGRCIYTCFDPPHLLKSLRNNFMNEKVQISISGKKVRWYDVLQTYKVDQVSTTTRAMPKLTDKHIHPTNFEKMRVKYAAQIFSHTVSAAILTALATKQLTSETAVNTAHFVKEINNIFDCLNSRVVKDSNCYKSALSVFRDIPKKTLQNSLTYFESIRVYENEKLRNNIYCIEGFSWTIRAVLCLWEDLKLENKKYLLTSRISQDPVENAFSVIRQRGGYNPQPTVQQFRLALQNNMHIRLQAPVETGNCEADTDKLLDMDTIKQKQNVEHTTETLTSGTVKRKSEEITIEVVEEESESEPTTLEECSNIYVAGYLCYKLFQAHDCIKCRKELCGGSDALLDTKQSLILHKAYGAPQSINRLIKPSQSMCDVAQLLFYTFNIFYDRFKLQYGIKSKIKCALVAELEDKYPHWINSCREHRLFVLNILIKIKLFRCLNWDVEEKQLKSKWIKPHRKVKILS